MEDEDVNEEHRKSPAYWSQHGFSAASKPEQLRNIEVSVKDQAIEAVKGELTDDRRCSAVLVEKLEVEVEVAVVIVARVLLLSRLTLLNVHLHTSHCDIRSRGLGWKDGTVCIMLVRALLQHWREGTCEPAELEVDNKFRYNKGSSLRFSGELTSSWRSS